MKTTLISKTLFCNRPKVTAEAVNERLLRIVATRGAVMGHIEIIDTPNGEGYRARRVLSGGRRFLDLGFFWNVRDAADCFA